MFRDQEIRKIADPMLSIQGHHYMEEAVERALVLAYMCLREDANARPTVKEVVEALDNIVRFIERKKKKKERNIGYGRRVELEKKGAVAVSSPKETTRMLSVNEIEVEVEVEEEEEDLERERAVADAKNWAETMRALRRQSNEPPKQTTP